MRSLRGERSVCYDRNNCPTLPCQRKADKGSVVQLPVRSEDKGVLVTHPGLEVIAPALFLDREPSVAIATGAVRDPFDHEHRAHLPFSGKASLLPSTSVLMNGRQRNCLSLFSAFVWSQQGESQKGEKSLQLRVSSTPGQQV